MPDAICEVVRRKRNLLVRPKKKYFCFLFPSVPKKTAVPKIFIAHLKKKVFILVLNHENRMKIGREMAEIRTKIALKTYTKEKIFNKKNNFPPSLVFLAHETGSKSIFY